MDLNAKIYVAGHRGLVGSAIERRLQQVGYRNIITQTHTELDLRNQSDVAAFFKHERPDYVLLAAAKVGGIIANNTYKAEFLYDNLMIASNVIEQSYKYGVTKLINLGSSCIYPKFAAQPIPESALLGGELESTNEPYAIAKIAALKLCRYYHEQYGFNAISLMPTNLYGSNDNYNLETSHVLPALIRKMFLGKALREGNVNFLRKDISLVSLGYGCDDAARNAETITEIAAVLEKSGITSDAVTLWGSGLIRREFLHADDIADAAVFFLENHTAEDIGEILNIGTGRDLPIVELAERIRRAVGFEGKLEFDRSKPDGTPRKVLDVSRAAALGWQYKTSLEEGLDRVIKEYAQARK
ncbi:GDP-L-fucose synthase [Ignavibacteria bacterium]|nr:GDP-L-fucose synthase [Bacteroidota bacterium]MCZ2132352.1 GDP-L-fucose synthase [Bacteroidota bacterium]